MKQTDLAKIIEFFETYYRIVLSDAEIKAISEEFKNITYQEFSTKIKSKMLKNIKFFTLAQLINLIDEITQEEYANEIKFEKKIKAENINKQINQIQHDMEREALERAQSNFINSPIYNKFAVIMQNKHIKIDKENEENDEFEC